MHELLEVERERRRGDAQRFGDPSRRQPLRPPLDEKPENAEPGLLRQGAQSRDHLFRIHHRLRYQG
jgi:hypothetical protein